METGLHSGTWVLDGCLPTAHPDQIRTYKTVWNGFVGLSIVLFGVHYRQMRYDWSASLLPWQGVMLGWPLSVLLLHMLLQRAETLPAAVFDRLVSTQTTYLRRSRSRTVLSHNGLVTVFKVLVFTNILTLALPLITQGTSQRFSSTLLGRICGITAWGTCIVTIVVSATALGLVQSQAPIEFTFTHPTSQNSDSQANRDESNTDEEEEFAVDPAKTPISAYLPLLKSNQWLLIARTSRRHDVYVRLNSSQSGKKDQAFDLATALASNHPLYSTRKTELLAPQLRAVYQRNA